MKNKRPLIILFVSSMLFFMVTGIFAGNRASRRLLIQQGYSGGFGLLSAADYIAVFCFAAVFSAVLSAIVCLLYLRAEKYKKRRIADLSAYLRRMNEGDYVLRPEIKEDELSPLEDEIYKSVILLREGREAARKEKERLADNLSDIAHQIKTPLASITLMSDLLSIDVSGKQADYVSLITAQTERLNTLVSALLTLSRLDAGTLELERKQVDIEEMMSSVKEALLTLLENKKQSILLTGDNSFYHGDIYWSIQAFVNIVKNCCEHSPAGGVITVKWEDNPICAVITVGDSGNGIPAGDLPHLFTRFYRGSNAGKDSAGIGLSLSKAVIEEQNGELNVRNKPEGGAEFTAKFYKHS